LGSEVGLATNQERSNNLKRGGIFREKNIWFFVKKNAEQNVSDG
jgi:hypothetical protein